MPVAFLILVAVIVFCIHYFDLRGEILLERYWPVILIIAGILQTLNSRFRDLTSAFLFTLVGALLLLFKLNLLNEVILWDYWPETIKGLMGTIVRMLTKSVLANLT